SLHHDVKPSQDFIFEVELRKSPNAHLGVDLIVAKTESEGSLLVVEKVASGGLIEDWNSHSWAPYLVQAGDMIVRANGVQGDAGAISNLLRTAQDILQITMMRRRWVSGERKLDYRPLSAQAQKQRQAVLESAVGPIARASTPQASYAGLLLSAFGALRASRRFLEEDATCGPGQVEDLPWWKYDRALALWYCEWLDTYYDSSDRSFLVRDELTQALEPADLEALREAAQRMRLELPCSDGDAEPPRTCEETLASNADHAEETENRLGDDGDWHVAALAACLPDEEISWKEDGQGNFTHWASEVGRLFLWQENAGVLYEYIPESKSEPAAAARYEARWALSPVAALSRRDDPRSAQLADQRGLLLGSEPGEAPSWTVLGAGVRPRHARVLHHDNGWWVEALDSATLLDGRRVDSAPLRHGCLLRLGDVEVRVDLPDFPGAARDAPEIGALGERSATVERGFVPQEPLVPRALSGTARARALNRALRRIVCGEASVSERREAQQRELLYADRAAKRRKLHPVEWEPQVQKQPEQYQDGCFAGRPALGYVAPTTGAGQVAEAHKVRRFCEAS
ncbi:unnamed protein product, partial [Effrenium voratum]